MKNRQVDVTGIDELLGLIPSSEISGNTELTPTPSMHNRGIQMSSSIAANVDELKKSMEMSQKILSALSSAPDGVPTFGPEFVVITDELSVLLGRGNKLLEICTYIMDGDISVDGEAIGAVAALISSLREIINAFIGLYRDKLRFIHNSELKKLEADLKWANKEKEIRLKHELFGVKETLNADGEVVPEAQQTNREWQQESIIKAIKDLEKKVEEKVQLPPTQEPIS